LRWVVLSCFRLDLSLGHFIRYHYASPGYSKFNFAGSVPSVSFPMHGCFVPRRTKRLRLSRFRSHGTGIAFLHLRTIQLKGEGAMRYTLLGLAFMMLLALAPVTQAQAQERGRLQQEKSRVVAFAGLRSKARHHRYHHRRHFRHHRHHHGFGRLRGHGK
jgi:hypothetical protein